VSNLEFTLLVSAIAAVAGFLGALTGLGGGVVITPVLTLLLGVDIRYAIGATLVSVIATSSGAAAAYVRTGFTNIRIAMFLEIATAAGAILGAYLATRTPTSALAVIFGVVLLFSAFLAMRRPPAPPPDEQPDALAERLGLNGSFLDSKGERSYRVSRVKSGLGLMFGSGTLGGMLGLGSGAMMVVAMSSLMRAPFKVAAATSSFMIGVTAAASAGIYLNRGYIDPVLAMPVTLGVLAGAMLGARYLARARTRRLRQLFALVAVVLALRMIWAGFAGGMR
jgi:uncharacterized protein